MRRTSRRSLVRDRTLLTGAFDASAIAAVLRQFGLDVPCVAVSFVDRRGSAV
jgi:hypothetical protein